MSLADADLLQDGLEVLIDNSEYIDRLGHKDAAPRFEKMRNRLGELTEAQRPSLAEGMFDEPPDDYDEGGA